MCSRRLSIPNYPIGFRLLFLVRRQQAVLSLAGRASEETSGKEGFLGNALADGALHAVSSPRTKEQLFAVHSGLRCDPFSSRRHLHGRHLPAIVTKTSLIKEILEGRFFTTATGLVPGFDRNGCGVHVGRSSLQLS